MSILISAPIRTGKTLYTVKCIFDELNKGRQVYTNIVGIKIDGVISVSSSIDKPFDWRIVTVHAQALRLLLTLPVDAAEARTQVLASLKDVLKAKVPGVAQSD